MSKFQILLSLFCFFLSSSCNNLDREKESAKMFCGCLNNNEDTFCRELCASKFKEYGIYYSIIYKGVDTFNALDKKEAFIFVDRSNAYYEKHCHENGWKE
jgi:hypothetical protein